MERNCGTCGWRNKGFYDTICTRRSNIECDYRNNYIGWASEAEAIRIRWEEIVFNSETSRVLKKDW